jgi:DHA1 family quinolone resistance protein-like MFS transporter
MQSVRRIKRTYYLIISLFWLAVALPAAIGVLIVQSRGMTLAQIGLLLAAYSLTIVLLEVPTGGLADAVGRKQVAMLAYACTALGALAYLFAFSFAAFLLAFIFNGVGRALSSGALDAWFVDALQADDPDIDLQPPLARAGVFALGALGIGTLIGSAMPLFFSQLPSEGTAVLTPFTTTLIASLFVHLLTLSATFFLVHEERIRATSSDWLQAFHQIPQLVSDAVDLSRRNATIRLLLAATLCSAAGIISLELLWQPHFADLFGGSDGKSLYFGIIMAGNFIAGMIGNLAATPVSRWTGQRYALVAAIFQGLRGLALILLAVQVSVPLAVLFFWLVYFNMGVVGSPHATLLNREIPSEQRSSVLSIDSLAAYLGTTVASIALGWVAQQTSINSAWIIAGLLVGGSTIFYLRINRQQQGITHVEIAPVLKAD